jgi:two-component system, cell cycle response regulator
VRVRGSDGARCRGSSELRVEMKRRRRELAPTMKFSTGEIQGFHPGRWDAALVVVQGNDADLGMHCVLDRAVTLGRDLDVELPLRDVGISRRHAMVEKDVLGRYVVSDLGSTNGTRVNGEFVTTPRPLEEGDKVIVGSTVLRFTRGDEADASFREQLVRVISTDHLTGLVAKRRYDAEYGLAVATAKQTKRPLSVLMMDMDGVKTINDTHGHHMGSFAIAEAGHILGEVIGLDGPTSRYGGDEFAAYLPGYDKPGAVKIADKARLALVQHHFEKDGVIIQPTISIGVSTFPDDGQDAETLQRKADEALYRAKAAGRNRVAI